MVAGFAVAVLDAVGQQAFLFRVQQRRLIDLMEIGFQGLLSGTELDGVPVETWRTPRGVNRGVFPGNRLAQTFTGEPFLLSVMPEGECTSAVR